MMGRGPATFKQNDATRLLLAVKAAGFHAGSVEVDKNGKIAVVTAQPAMDTNDKRDDEWDNL